MLGKLFPYFFYGLLGIFLFFYLRSIDYGQFKNAEYAWQFMLVSGILALSARFWQVYIWFTLLKGLGAKDLKSSRVQLIYVYAKSWLGRYIPGTAPWILGKIYFASKHGISKNKLAVSSLLEGALQIAVVLSIAFVMLFFDRRLDVVDPKLKIFMFCVVVGCLVAITPPIFNRIVALAYRVLKKQDLSKDHYANSKMIARGAALYAVGALMTGLSLFFIAKAVYPSLGYDNAFFVMGAANLAGAVSMLAVFAPSGLGVREGIQLALLSIIMPTEFALLVTITTRLWSICMDFVFFGIAALLHEERKR